MTALHEIKTGNAELLLSLTDAELQSALAYAHQEVNGIMNDTRRIVATLGLRAACCRNRTTEGRNHLARPPAGAWRRDVKIKTITFEHRNDFRAVMECEHCGATQQNNTGYHDNYYHTAVIPGMYCKSCGKNRAGEQAEQADAALAKAK